MTVVRSAVREQRPVVQDSDPLGEAEDDRDVVLDHEHGPALLVQAPDQLGQARNVLAVNAGHRLVEQQDVRVTGHEDGQLELALVAMGQEPVPGGSPAP